MSAYVFMVLPEPKEVRYSRKHREWTAADDDAQVVAAGRTKKEAVANWQKAWWALVSPALTARRLPR